MEEELKEEVLFWAKAVYNNHRGSLREGLTLGFLNVKKTITIFIFVLFLYNVYVLLVSLKRN